jgi:hypothetical protein
MLEEYRCGKHLNYAETMTEMTRFCHHVNRAACLFPRIGNARYSPNV